jgi:GNAT superfamily N-acetyltransferase
MPTIRRYKQSDARRVGVLVADTYNEFNLSEFTLEQQKVRLGPFFYARSSKAAHQKAIADALRAPIVLVAEMKGQIVGVLRGGRIDEKGRTVLQSLFVSGKHHRHGIGRTLVGRFEKQYVRRGVRVFKLLATLYAVPFYPAMGYRKSTGIRSIHSFEEPGLPSQPMKKIIPGKR